MPGSVLLVESEVYPESNELGKTDAACEESRHGFVEFVAAEEGLSQDCPDLEKVRGGLREGSHTS